MRTVSPSPPEAEGSIPGAVSALRAMGAKASTGAEAVSLAASTASSTRSRSSLLMLALYWNTRLSPAARSKAGNVRTFPSS